MNAPQRSFFMRRQIFLAYHLQNAPIGNLQDLQTARIITQKINANRSPEKTIRASDLSAGALILESLGGIIHWYKQKAGRDILLDSYEALRRQIGEEALQKTFLAFIELYPPKALLDGRMTADQYISGRESALLEELTLLRLANENPAFASLRELFDDTELVNNSPYLRVYETLRTYLVSKAPRISTDNLSSSLSDEETDLWEMLTHLFRRYPNSLEAQLAFLRGRWGSRLADVIPAFEIRFLRSEDYIREETRPVFPITDDNPPPPAPSAFDWQKGMRAIIQEDGGDEPEAFSEDLDWMPNVVMIAKSTLVWLFQLSQQYGREITRLDQVPDEELDKLRSWGITALWFIGIWERSKASERFKQRMGNPEATASAYSLYDYEVASALGGREAFLNLKARAWRRGIRIASDMVPNHTGLDGEWVLQHPDRFIQLPNSPYPAYAFTNEDLSDDPNIGIFMEDHYYNRTDAAVVFKRLDRRTGEERYIYHGNDGTGLAWNDTAQINFLNPEAREAVIQTILRVARDFPIIRLDAAMVLAKRHIHRLWFPEPGKGGDVASRSEHGLTKEEFEQAMPEEFWREVVDRVAIEAPDTLLLAEAFWMLEGYFVRTLGMHRVYNSAFMHMLRDERNDEFRFQITSTLEYDPEILKRYVNFLNNPDEKTAVEQFGKGDKYFGVTILMLTLPGLPMIGHGQIEGLSEKYGMEYRRSYYNETPDLHLMERHQREIFPIAHKRYLFAGVTDFRFYDFLHNGEVNTNVMAYTNRAGNERALVLFNNSYHRSQGVFRSSVKFRNKQRETQPETPVFETQHVAEALGLKKGTKWFTIFRDQISGLEYLRSNAVVWGRGISISLSGYQSMVFTDFREVEDTIGLYRELHDSLHGHGVSNVEEEIKLRQLRPLHEPFVEVLSTLLEAFESDAPLYIVQPETFSHTYGAFIREAAARTGGVDIDLDSLVQEIQQLAEAVIAYEHQRKEHPTPALPENIPGWGNEEPFPHAEPEHPYLDMVRFRNATLAGWLAVNQLGRLTSKNGRNVGHKSRGFIEAWLLDKPMHRVFREHGLGSEDAGVAVVYVCLLTSQKNWFKTHKTNTEIWQNVIHDLFNDPLALHYMDVHEWGGVRYFRKERFEELLHLLGVLAKRQHHRSGHQTLSNINALLDGFSVFAQQAGYRCDAILETDFAALGLIPSEQNTTTDEAAADLLTQTTDTMAYKFEVYQDKKGEYRFRFKASNGQVMFASQGYEQKASALKSIESIRANAADAIIEEVENKEDT